MADKKPKKTYWAPEAGFSMFITLKDEKGKIVHMQTPDGGYVRRSGRAVPEQIKIIFEPEISRGDKKACFYNVYNDTPKFIVDKLEEKVKSGELLDKKGYRKHMDAVMAEAEEQARILVSEELEGKDATISTQQDMIAKQDAELVELRKYKAAMEKQAKGK
jgi:hypothetical protein